MHITGMTIGGIPPFTEPVEFKFDERVNVFVGPNAVGKSTLVNVLVESIFDHWQDELKILASGDWPSASGGHFGPRGPSTAKDVDHKDWSRLPFIKIGAVRTGLPRIAYLSGDEAPARASVGAKTLKDVFGNYYEDVFCGPNVEIAVELLANLAESFPCFKESAHARFELKRAMEISFFCAKDINREVITGVQLLNIVGDVDNLESNLLATPPVVRIGMAAETVDGDSLPIHSLSFGTQGPLLWIRFLALQILYHYGFEKGWEKQPAILLIDEIENHLHPTWQRRVIPALLEHFPGLQIFATTHSPFVVAGLKAGQVHRLYRDEEGIVRAEPPNDVDIMGWTMDEILRGFMGVQDPTDDETARNAAELRRLRGRGATGYCGGGRSTASGNEQSKA